MSWNEPGTTVIAREIKTVEGYVLDGTPQDILIKAGQVQQLTRLRMVKVQRGSS